MEQHVADGEADAEDVAGPDGTLGRLLIVETVQERRQEGAGKRAPGITHELCDEGGRVQCDDDRQDGEECHQHLHDEQLLLVGHVLHHGFFQHVQGQSGAGGQHQGRQGGHGSREDQHYHEADQEIRQGGEHLRDDGVVGDSAVCLVDFRTVEETSEAAQEVAAAGHHEGEDGGNHGSGVNSLLILDGVELVHHLGKTPGTEGGQNYNAEETCRVRAEEAGQKPLASLESRNGHIIRRNLGKLLEGCEETALALQHRDDNRADAEQHDDSLDKVIEGCGHVSADDNVHGG